MNYKACLVVVNSLSTTSEAAAEQLPILEKYFTKVHITRINLIKKDFSNPERIQQRLHDLPKNSLVVIIGGDGTINMVANVIAAESLADTLTILPLKGGNASDIAHMTHGSQAGNLQAILESNTEVTAYALRTSIDGTPGLALAYMSIGALAFAMHELDGLSRDSKILQKIRLLSLAVEAFAGVKSLLSAQRTQLRINNHGAARYYDVTILVGSRIAKVYKSPNRLTKPRILTFVIKHKHPVLLRHIVCLAASYLRPLPKARQIQIEIFEQAWLQVDGEVTQLKRGSTLIVQKELQPYKILRYSS